MNLLTGLEWVYQLLTGSVHVRSDLASVQGTLRWNRTD